MSDFSFSPVPMMNGYQAVPLPRVEPFPMDVMVARSRLRRLVQIVKNKCSLWHRCIDDYERDFFLENTGDDNPEVLDEDRARVSDLADAVTLGQMVLSNAGYKLLLDRPGELEQDKKLAGAVEEYLRACIDANYHRTGENLTSRIIYNALALSGGPVHWMYSPDVMGDMGEMDAPLNQSPIEIFSIDPRLFFPLVGGTGGSTSGQFKYVCHIESRCVADVYDFVYSALGDDPIALAQMQEYNTGYTDAQLYETKKEFINYWGWERHPETGEWVVANAIMYGDSVLRSFTPMVNYRHLPWAMATARDTGNERYEKRWLPLTWHAKRHVRRIEKLQGRMDAIMDDVANMQNILKTSIDSPQPPQFTGNSSKILVLPPGQDFMAAPYGSLPKDLYPQMDIASHRAQKALFADQMYGIAGPSSGYAYDQAQEGGRLRLIEARDSLAFTWRQMFKGISSLVAIHEPDREIYVVVDKSVGDVNSFIQGAPPANRIVLRGMDLLGWYMQVTWSARMPGDEIRYTTMAVQLKGAMLLSDETIRERYLQVENVMAEAQKLLKERVMLSHPKISEAVAWTIIAEMGVLPDLMTAEATKMRAKIEDIRAQGFTQGLSQEEVEARVNGFLQGLRMAVAQGMGGAGGTPPEQQMGNTQGPVPPNMPQPPSAPSTTSQMTGGPPPGNPADPAAVMRETANSMTLGET